MRLILYLGKGGVGKTTTAAATAVRAAELGHRTLVVSTDVAHSLADALDQPLGALPTQITERLWGQEINVLDEVRQHWGELREYLAMLLRRKGVDDVASEELAIKIFHAKLIERTIRMAPITSPNVVRSATRVGTLLVIAVVAIVLLALMFASWRSIAPGYVGIVFDKANHNVTARAREPGWAFINPFTQAIQEYPVTIQTYSMVLKGTEGQTGGDDSVKVQSNEGQQLNLDAVIQYQVIKDEAGQLYQDWGGADITTVEDRVVRQYTRSQVPVVASKYGWEEITSSKRDVINAEISSALSAEFAKRHLSLISFAIREVHLPQSLQDALNQKIQAQQAAEQQKYQLQQAQVKAQQDVAEAEGHANALKAQAEGEAQATLTRAQAQAQANQQLAKSLTPDLIRYEQLQKWDGKLPVFTGGTTPLVDATSIISGTAGR